jgi:hypothetical protein
MRAARPLVQHHHDVLDGNCEHPVARLSPPAETLGTDEREGGQPDARRRGGGIPPGDLPPLTSPCCRTPAGLSSGPSVWRK